MFGSQRPAGFTIIAIWLPPSSTRAGGCGAPMMLTVVSLLLR
jgi:hypothetical protein